MHSLPDNTLNPLGLLAEASLANRRNQSSSKTMSAGDASDDKSGKVGVASEVYFKPGECLYSIIDAELRSHASSRAYDDFAATPTLHRATSTT